eukprot:TRINITY_DN3961_c0_g1_i1.p1 TRINITY_DN3961_c0_g1~~TRINITY_DN3961_c0_g1_i1.p1  ORF type:complete len:331 (-),score=14.63 TRINITY_DN3961_c0_g1_i1:660-1652(-)
MDSNLPFIVFAKEPSSSLLCSICHEVFRDAHHVVPCCHTFCKSCISSWLPLNKSCPTCRKAALPNAMAPAHVVNDIVGDILVCCPKGIFAPSSSSSHTSKVGVLGVDWKIKQGGCQVRLPLKDMPKHWKSCGVEKVQDEAFIYCPLRCGTRILVRFDKPSDIFREHIEDECMMARERKIVRCPHKSCGVEVERGQIDSPAFHRDAGVSKPQCPFCYLSVGDLHAHVQEYHSECWSAFEAETRPNQSGNLSVRDIVRVAGLVMLSNFERQFGAQERNRMFNSIKGVDTYSMDRESRIEFAYALKVLRWPSWSFTSTQRATIDSIVAGIDHF